MQAFIDFFQTLPTSYKLFWVLLWLTIFGLLEGGVPMAKIKFNKLQHDAKNLVFLGTSLLINLLFGLATAGVFIWTSDQSFGLLHLVDWPIWAELLVAVVLLDLFAQYVSHYMLHKVSWMWRFHMVHHSDTIVDATTGTRHHPGDYLIREVYSLLVIVLTGMPLAYYIFYRIATIFFTYFSHANIYLPQWIDKPLSLIFITPNMHKFHHHFERPWTDSNFGNIFSFWDRLFGTMVYDDPRKVQYGLDVLEDETANDVGYQFKLPFNKEVKTDY